METNTKNNEKLVWYACYGSNIMYERFLCYIQGGKFYANNKCYEPCSDKTEPRGSKAIKIPFEMYFGNESPSWDNTGVAFIDISKNGETLGRMYLIAEEQFEEVWIQEGKGTNWYNKLIELGEYEGYPIKTFTNSIKRPENKPSENYLKVIQKGYKEIESEIIININH